MKKITTNRMSKLKIYVASQKVITLNNLQVLFPDIDLEIIKYFIEELVEKKVLKVTDKIGEYKKVPIYKAEKKYNKNTKRREIINYICMCDSFSKDELKKSLVFQIQLFNLFYVKWINRAKFLLSIARFTG